jgi:hypothetical protein
MENREELSEEELDAEEGEELPDREAMSVITPDAAVGFTQVIPPPMMTL